MWQVHLAAAQHLSNPYFGVKFPYDYGLRDSGHSFIHSLAPMCSARQREAAPHTKGRDPQRRLEALFRDCQSTVSADGSWQVWVCYGKD